MNKSQHSQLKRLINLFILELVNLDYLSGDLNIMIAAGDLIDKYNDL